VDEGERVRRKRRERELRKHPIPIMEQRSGTRNNDAKTLSFAHAIMLFSLSLSFLLSCIHSLYQDFSSVSTFKTFAASSTQNNQLLFPTSHPSLLFIQTILPFINNQVREKEHVYQQKNSTFYFFFL